MKFTFRHISFAVAFLAVAGLLGSLSHYHNETLECLNHVDEQHYVQNDIICPVCTLTLDDPAHVESTFNGYLAFETFVETLHQVFINPVSIYLEPGRAPPPLA